MMVVVTAEIVPMPDANAFATPFTRPLPCCQNARVALVAMRRMGAHGLADAAAAHLMFMAFGPAFRRPLLLLRTLVADLAANARGTIAIAPCCCTRMTAAETALVTVLARNERDPETARLLMADLLGHRAVDGVLAAAAAVGASFADAGRPIGLDRPVCRADRAP